MPLAVALGRQCLRACTVSRCGWSPHTGESKPSPAALELGPSLGPSGPSELPSTFAKREEFVRTWGSRLQESHADPRSSASPRAKTISHVALARGTDVRPLADDLAKDHSRNNCLIVAFRSAKGRSFAERKTTLVSRTMLALLRRPLLRILPLPERHRGLVVQHPPVLRVAVQRVAGAVGDVAQVAEQGALVPFFDFTVQS